jgi:hypothetical protein
MCKSESDESEGNQSQEFQENIIAIWSKVIDTQMHFNEMSVKSRQLGLTFVAAALGLAVFLFSRSSNEAKYVYPIIINGRSYLLHVAEVIVLAAAAAVYAVQILDVHVYHKMLRGAVTFGEDLEETHLRKFLGLSKGMTQAISHFSRHSDAHTHHAEGKLVYCGSKKRSAAAKISKFYWTVIIFLIVCAVLMFIIGNQLL